MRAARVGGGGEDGVDGVDLVGTRAEVDLRGVAVEAEVALGGGVSDEHGGVDLGGEHCGVEDADEVEPLPADSDPLAGVDRSPDHGERSWACCERVLTGPRCGVRRLGTWRFNGWTM
jgi:hypothetical protein